MNIEYNNVGTMIIIKFLQPTNQANFNSVTSFQCSKLLDFKYNNEYECVWITDTELHLIKSSNYVNTNNYIHIHTIISLSSNKNLKAKCTNLDNNCDNWESSNTISSIVKIPLKN